VLQTRRWWVNRRCVFVALFFFSKIKLYYYLQYFFDFNSFINYIFFFFYATTVDPLYYYQKLVFIVFTLEMRRWTPPHDIIYYWNSIPSVLLSYIIRILYTNTMILYPREFVLHASRGDNNVNNYYYLVYHCHIVCATL